jgi:hypothetical protein
VRYEAYDLLSSLVFIRVRPLCAILNKCQSNAIHKPMNLNRLKFAHKCARRRTLSHQCKIFTPKVNTDLYVRIRQLIHKMNLSF